MMGAGRREGEEVGVPIKSALLDLKQLFLTCFPGPKTRNPAFEKISKCSKGWKCSKG